MKAFIGKLAVTTTTATERPNDTSGGFSFVLVFVCWLTGYTIWPIIQITLTTTAAAAVAVALGKVWVLEEGNCRGCDKFPAEFKSQ